MIKNIPLEKIASFAAFSGILGPGIISLGILISGLVYVGVEEQRYNPLNHFVSELGELGVSNLAAAFNIGLIIGGILNTVFMIYLAIQIEHWIRYPLSLLCGKFERRIGWCFPDEFPGAAYSGGTDVFRPGDAGRFPLFFHVFIQQKTPIPEVAGDPRIFECSRLRLVQQFPLRV